MKNINEKSNLSSTVKADDKYFSSASYNSYNSFSSILNYEFSKIKVKCDDVDVCIKPVEVKDYAEIRKLLPQVSRVNTVHSNEDIQELLNLPTFHAFCAYREDTGDLVGFAELHRMPHLGRKFDGRLERLVVDESFRNKSLGTKMIEFIINAARDKLNCGRIDLTVEKPNARQIYEKKFGFTQVDTTTMRLFLEHLK